MTSRSDDRIKQTGEVFTPLALVDEILEKLPRETWKSRKNFIDPAAGDGNFLVRVVAWKLFKDMNTLNPSPLWKAPVTALRHTYGVELMRDNVEDLVPGRLGARTRVLVHAFEAAKWIDKKETRKILYPRDKLSRDDELRISQSSSFLSHVTSEGWDEIVNRNIVCANSLTEWDFENWKSKISPVDSSP